MRKPCAWQELRSAHAGRKKASAAMRTTVPCQSGLRCHLGFAFTYVPTAVNLTMPRPAFRWPWRHDDHGADANDPAAPQSSSRDHLDRYIVEGWRSANVGKLRAGKDVNRSTPPAASTPIPGMYSHEAAHDVC